MSQKIKLFGVVAVVAFLSYRTAVTTHASRDGMEGPSVTADGVLFHAGLNSHSDTDPEFYGVIEGSVTFMANIDFQKVKEHMLDPGVLGQISPLVSEYTATKTLENEDVLTYAVEETIAPLPQMGNGEPAKAWLNFHVNKRALADDTIAVTFELDKEKPNKWARLSGRIYGLDLHNGYSMFMVASSSKSHYEARPSDRIFLVREYLKSTKDQIVDWLNSIN